MKPYVYIIQNIERTHWYVGMRSANRCSAIEDIEYWGSSKYLKKLINKTGQDQWKKTIVAEFDTAAEASEHETELLELMWDWDGRVNKARGGFVDHNDPEVKEKHKAGCQKNAQNPEWVANQKVGVQKRSRNPEYIANQKAAHQKQKKPFIATSITTGEEFYCESLSCEQTKALKLESSAVSNCLNGKFKQHKGFAFRYV